MVHLLLFRSGNSADFLFYDEGMVLAYLFSSTCSHLPVLAYLFSPDYSHLPIPTYLLSDPL